MLRGMKLMIDAFWRAAMYCLHPRVIMLSLLPLVLMAALSLGAGYFFWEAAVDGVRHTVESWTLVGTLLAWLDSVGLGGFRALLAPLVVIFLATPVIVMLSLLAVSWMMTPALLTLVSLRRFPHLARLRGGSGWGGAAVALSSVVVALLAMAVSVPLWFVPPLVLVLPPLIWGWLAYRVMSYDALAEHASKDERKTLIKRHRGPLLAMGVMSGYLGAAPSVVWASGAMLLPFAPVLVPVAVWIYTLVFAFSSLWFAHYCLAALQHLRAEPVEVPATAVVPPAPTTTLSPSAAPADLQGAAAPTAPHLPTTAP
jgi:hypothetical protein